MNSQLSYYQQEALYCLQITMLAHRGRAVSISEIVHACEDRGVTRQGLNSTMNSLYRRGLLRRDERYRPGNKKRYSWRFSVHGLDALYNSEPFGAAAEDNRDEYQNHQPQ